MSANPSATASHPSNHLTITLIFLPNTRQLAKVDVFLAPSDLDDNADRGRRLDLGDMIDSHIQVNDVHGLVTAVLARVRTEFEKGGGD